MADDLYGLGRAARSAVQSAHAGRGFFACARRLLPTGWQGASEAGCSWVDEADLEKLGGMAKLPVAGANTFFANTVDGAAQAADLGLRALLRLPLTDETSITRVAAQLREGLRIDGVVPTAADEPSGLATLIFVARCRLELPVAHVVADVFGLGAKLGQLCLGFGADELFGPIVPERPLRLGAHAGNRDISRIEAVRLLHGAGLRPTERLADGSLQERTP
jgi:hypothetical protein